MQREHKIKLLGLDGIPSDVPPIRFDGESVYEGTIFLTNGEHLTLPRMVLDKDEWAEKFLESGLEIDGVWYPPHVIASVRWRQVGNLVV
ncbi:MAG: hypothetical protein ACYTBX_20915 [Planctomycetota bacterium]|jgi:hypothetical protein